MGTIFYSLKDEIIPDDNENFDEWLVGSKVRGVMENGSGIFGFVFVLNIKLALFWY